MNNYRAEDFDLESLLAAFDPSTTASFTTSSSMPDTSFDFLLIPPSTFIRRPPPPESPVGSSPAAEIPPAPIATRSRRSQIDGLEPANIVAPGSSRSRVPRKRGTDDEVSEKLTKRRKPFVKHSTGCDGSDRMCCLWQRCVVRLGWMCRLRRQCVVGEDVCEGRIWSIPPTEEAETSERYPSGLLQQFVGNRVRTLDKSAYRNSGSNGRDSREDFQNLSYAPEAAMSVFRRSRVCKNK
ncbi:hypothetical protein C8R44DRAFT_749258 [Mycena epipterygia]|nr:hypothetical protein C8R44DRAFT_749258 [Mycena epipterygia]